MIRTKRYVLARDLTEEGLDAYRDFVYECGVGNGEHWEWTVNEHDGVPEAWIGLDKCGVIDEALRSFGLKDGESIDIVFEW